MHEPADELLRFGPFELDSRTGELRRDGQPVSLAPQPARVLALLASRSPGIVLRTELQDEIWPDTVVDYENGLNFCILQIRRALEDDAEEPEYVETVPRRGYRLIAPVERVRRRPRRSSTPGGRRSLSAASPTALQAGVVGFFFLAALVTLVGFWLGSPGALEPGGDAGSPVVLAVLPFESLEADAVAPYLGAGLAEEITAELGVLDPDRISVLAPGSIGRRAGTEAPPAGTAERLGADLVLTGSVRRAAGEVRVIARLIRAGDGAQLSVHSYQRPVENMALLQRDVADEVATSLALRLRSPDPAREAMASDPEAVERYLEARYLLGRSGRDAVRRSIGLFRQALGVEPEFPAALAGLATAHLYSGEPATEAMPKARKAALRALHLDPSNAEAHLRLADVRARYDWNWTGAADSYERALALAPQMAEAHYHHASLLSQLGRHAEAVDGIRRARLLDPVSPAVNADAGWIYFFARRYDEAVAQCQRALRMWPRSRHARECLVNAHLHAGDLREAAAEARRLLPLLGVADTTVERLDPEPPAASLGRFWRLYLERLPAAELLPGEAPLLEAVAHAALGNRELGLEALERAVAGRVPTVIYAGVDPRLDPLRGEERFARVLRDLGLGVPVAARTPRSGPVAASTGKR